MKAIVVTAPRQVQMTQVEKPRLRPQDVLVKVRYAGICGTDIDIIKGEIDLVTDGRIRYPIRIGHEWSGIVEAVGEDVPDIRVGDRVVSETFVSCGGCPACRAGDYEHCRRFAAIGTIDNPWPGAFAEYMCVPWYNIYPIPDGVPLDIAALAEPASIAYCAIRAVRPEPNEPVLIIGTGAIGLAAAGILRCKGFENILVAGRQDEKLRIAKALGASAVINVTREDLLERVKQETGGRGAGAVLESSGAAECVRQAVDAAADGGRVALYSFYTRTLDDFPIARLSSHIISLMGVPIEGGTQREILRWMADGILDLSPLITHRYPFEQAAEILEDFGRCGPSRIKVLLEMP